MAQVLYRFGTQDQYNALTPKDVNTLYFISDTQRIYKGEILHGSADIITGTAVPEFDTAIAGKLYVVFGTNGVSLYVKGQTAMEQAGGGKVQAGAISDISAFDDSILDKGASGNTKIPTTDKVSELIAAAVADYDGAFVNVSAAQAQDKSGTVLTFTPKSGEAKSVTIADLFLTSASYSTETRKLTLTVQGGDTVEVDLGDLVPQAVSTKDVAIAEDIVVTTDVGNFKKGQTISVAQTADLQTFLLNMLSQDSNPVATQPTASITLTGAGNVEVGTTFTPRFTASLNPGKYVANGKTQASGVTATTYAFKDSKNNEIPAQESASGQFDAFDVADGDSYTVTVTVAHTEGDMPKTFLGKEYADAQIQAGSKTATSSAMRAYRKTFYGALTSKAGEINSDLVRGLANSTTSASSAGTKLTVSVPAGTLRIVIAYPGTLRDVSSITSAEEFGSEIKDSFTQHVISVDGAKAETGMNYKVYVKDLASAQGSATTYTVTI